MLGPWKKHVSTRLGAALIVVVAAVVAAPPARAGVDPAGTTLTSTELRKLAPVVVAPMGTKAAAVTLKARGGKPRPSAGRPTPLVTTGSRDVAATPFHELQLNLCNSGLAGCYADGNALYEGGDLIYYLAPSVVTLNEICLNDIASYLQPSLAEAWPGDWTYSVFYPATDKRTNGPYRCSNGDEFGNAVMGRVAAASYRGVNAWAGRYTAQVSTDNELRTFACAYAIGDHLSCATHLASGNEPIALSQCRALMFDAVPYIRSQEALSGRTVVGGDFNLEYDPADPEDAQRCVPGGHIRKGDGDVQHVVYSNDLGSTSTSTSTYGMSYTDHDGFLVRLTKP